MCFTLIPAVSRPADSRGRDGSSTSPEVCLYSQSHFLPSPDILTTSEVSQLFQGINDGSGSPYLTFTAQAACFVVVLSAWLSGKGFRQSPCCSPCVPHGRHSHSCLCPPKLSLHPLHLWMPHRLGADSPREFPEVPPAMLWHPLVPSYLLGCGLSQVLLSVFLLPAQAEVIWVVFHYSSEWWVGVDWVNSSECQWWDSLLIPQEGSSLEKSWPREDKLQVLPVTCCSRLHWEAHAAMLGLLGDPSFNPNVIYLGFLFLVFPG